jgi:hypothetical protein
MERDRKLQVFKLQVKLGHPPRVIQELPDITASR